MYHCTPTLPTHEQADRKTKCITTLTHHPLTNSQTRKMYHRLVSRQAGRRADKMYYHTCASPSHKQTDRQMDEMYYCTPTSPTREQSDGQTKYVSPSREQAGRQNVLPYLRITKSQTNRQTDGRNVLLYARIAHPRTVRRTDKICITVS